PTAAARPCGPRSDGLSPPLPSTRAAMSNRVASTSPCTSRGSGRTRYQIDRPATAAMTRPTMMEGARAGRGRLSSVGAFFACGGALCVAALGVDSFISSPTALLDTAFAAKVPVYDIIHFGHSRNLLGAAHVRDSKKSGMRKAREKSDINDKVHTIFEVDRRIGKALHFI